MFAPQPGGQCSAVPFLKRGTVIARIFGIFNAIIVFGVLADNGKEGKYSVFNGKDGPLNYTIGVGVFAFLVAVSFLLMELAYCSSGAFAAHQKILKALDLFFSGLLTMLWFIGACWTANEWSKTTHGFFHTDNQNAARTSIAFSFFSVVTWGILTFFTVRKGVLADNDEDEFAGAADPGTAYAAFAEEDDAYA